MSFSTVRRRRLLSQALRAASALSLMPLGIGLADAATTQQPLPQRAPGSRRGHVVVVGAGLAGLAAARELTRGGYRVTVLEARERPGGRVHSVAEPFSAPLRSELGAVVFSGSYQVANRYIDELGLARAPYLPPDLPALHHVGGKRRAVAPGDSLQDLYDLSAEEAKLGAIGITLEYFVKALPEEATQPDAWPSAVLRELDRVSFADFLRAQGASEGAIRLVRDGLYFGWDPEHASALSIALTDIGLFFQGDPMFVLAGGNASLPRGLAAELGDAVRYGTEVLAVTQGDDRVRLRVRRGGVETNVEADRVILALPAPVLARRSEPFSLAQPLRQALAALPQHDILRVQFEVDSAFWREEGVSGAVVTDLFGGRVDRQPYSDVGAVGQPAILDALVVGEDARRWAALDDAALLQTVARELARAHPRLPQHRRAHAIQRWVSDPYTLGGWSWPSPGFVASQLSVLQAPQGRIHFAGEHTSLLRATMEGALQSGVRVAREIDQTESALA